MSVSDPSVLFIIRKPAKGCLEPKISDFFLHSSSHFLTEGQNLLIE